MTKIKKLFLENPNLRAFSRYTDSGWFSYCLDNCQGAEDDTLEESQAKLQMFIVYHDKWFAERLADGDKVYHVRPPLEFYFWYYLANLAYYWDWFMSREET